jgi:hypothetical protein
MVADDEDKKNTVETILRAIQEIMKVLLESEKPPALGKGTDEEILKSILVCLNRLMYHNQGVLTAV